MDYAIGLLESISKLEKYLKDKSGLSDWICTPDSYEPLVILEHANSKKVDVGACSVCKNCLQHAMQQHSIYNSHHLKYPKNTFYQCH